MRSDDLEEQTSLDNLDSKTEAVKEFIHESEITFPVIRAMTTFFFSGAGAAVGAKVGAVIGGALGFGIFSIPAAIVGSVVGAFTGYLLSKAFNYGVKKLAERNETMNRSADFIGASMTETLEKYCAQNGKSFKTKNYQERSTITILSRIKGFYSKLVSKEVVNSSQAVTPSKKMSIPLSPTVTPNDQNFEEEVSELRQRRQ